MVSFEKRFYKHTSEFRLTKTLHAQRGSETKRCGQILISLSVPLLERLNPGLSGCLSTHLDLLSSHYVLDIDLAFRDAKITKV